MKDTTVLLLSEVPVVGQIRVVYQKTGQRRYPAEKKGRKIEDGVQIVLVFGLRDQLLPNLRMIMIGLLMTKLRVFLHKQVRNKRDLIKQIQEYQATAL